MTLRYLLSLSYNKKRKKKKNKEEKEKEKKSKLIRTEKNRFSNHLDVI